MSRAIIAPLPATTSKSAGDENFPVASLLLSRAVRRQVMAFYAFARAADDIADDPALDAAEKLARLDALEESLAGNGTVEPACTLRTALGGDAMLLAHAAQLLQAFRRDALVDHCRDWGDLMAYCRYSAAPVGRFLLALHGEDETGLAASDSLCAALQVLNHLQDCGSDYGQLARVYIPRDWLSAAGLSQDVLAEEQAPPALRRVLEQMLDHVDGLVDLAHPLPSHIASPRLRCQAAITLGIARRLSGRLRRADPLAARVRLGPLDYVSAFIEGVLRGMVRGS